MGEALIGAELVLEPREEEQPRRAPDRRGVVGTHAEACREGSSVL